MASEWWPAHCSCCGDLLKFKGQFFMCFGRTSAVFYASYSAKHVESRIQALWFIAAWLKTQALKLRKVGLKFRGPMQQTTVDESRIPAMGQKVVAIVDPSVGNEESQGLVFDYGKYLGYFSSDGFRIWDHGVLVAPTRVERTFPLRNLLQCQMLRYKGGIWNLAPLLKRNV